MRRGIPDSSKRTKCLVKLTFGYRLESAIHGASGGGISRTGSRDLNCKDFFLFWTINSCAVRRMSYKMGYVSSFWCHICACKFMRAYIYQAIFRVGRGVGDHLKYSPVAAKTLLCWENVWKDLKKAI